MCSHTMCLFYIFPESVDGEDFAPTSKVIKFCHGAMLPQPSITQQDGLVDSRNQNHKVGFILVFLPHTTYMQDFLVFHLITAYIKNVHNHSAAVSSAWKSPRVQFERCY